jgi:hypothetical protein
MGFKHGCIEELHRILYEFTFVFNAVSIINSFLISQHFLVLFRESDSLSIQTEDMTQFWTLELDRVVKRIRRDFETFYTRIHQRMVAYYQTKTEELETYVKQDLQTEQIDIEQFTVTQQKLTIEYEQVQQTLSYEKEIFFKLDSTYCK